MKTPLRIALALFILPFAFSVSASSAHASYTTYSVSGIGNYTSIVGHIRPEYLTAIVNDIYSDGGQNNPYCTSGHCGYPLVCNPDSSSCGGNGGKGDFTGRVDSEFAFGMDDANFSNGFPFQLLAWQGGYDHATVMRICQDINQYNHVTYGVPIDPTISETHVNDGSGNDGNDGGTRNSIGFLPNGWDVFASDHHYADYLGGNQAREAIESFSCLSNAGPAQTLTIGSSGGSSASVSVGQKVPLTWSDQDFSAGAAQTCSASVTAVAPAKASDATAFSVPTPDASNFPVPTCFNGGTATVIFGKDDPAQTSTLMSVPRDSKGDALYQYACDNSRGISSPAGCQDKVSTCLQYDPDGGQNPFCIEWYTTAYCAVAPPSGTISVTASKAGVYNYNYTCKNAGGGPITKTVTLTVTDTGSSPSVSCAGTPGTPDTGEAVSWLAAASGGSGTYSTYSWTDTAGNTSGNLPTNQWNVSSGYASKGIATATITVTDSKGATGTNTCNVRVGGDEPPPTTADLTATTSAMYSAPVAPGVTTTYSEMIGNVGTLPASPAFPVLFQWAYNSNGTGARTISTPTAPALATGYAQELVSTTFATSTPGTFYIRACANTTDNSTFGPVDEGTNTGNNCGPWTQVVVAAPVPTVTCAITSPASCRGFTQGDTCRVNDNDTVVYKATLSGGATTPYVWTSSIPCTQSGATDSCTYVVDGTYENSVQATGPAYPGICAEVKAGSGQPVCDPADSIALSATPSRVAKNGVSTLKYTINNTAADSCMITGPNGWQYPISINSCQPIGGVSRTVETPQITARSVFTLTCNSSVSAVVNLPPGFLNF